MDWPKLLPVIPSLNKVLQAGLHVDSPYKQTLLLTLSPVCAVTSSDSSADKIRGHRLSKQPSSSLIVLREEDDRRDFGCWLNYSNWWLNEFTEPWGRG